MTVIGGEINFLLCFFLFNFSGTVLFQVLASRHHLQTAAAAAAPKQPLEHLRSDMVLALQLASALEQSISPYLPATTVHMEMQVAAMLANMESVGMGKSQSTCNISALPAVACQESC